jgi:hypothetical protein
LEWERDEGSQIHGPEEDGRHRNAPAVDVAEAMHGGFDALEHRVGQLRAPGVCPVEGLIADLVRRAVGDEHVHASGNRVPRLLKRPIIGQHERPIVIVWYPCNIIILIDILIILKIDNRDRRYHGDPQILIPLISHS